MLFVESDSEMTLEDNPTRGFIIDDVIRADETKCPYEKYFQCKYNFKSNLLLERHINNCHPEKYTEVKIMIKFFYLFTNILVYDHCGSEITMRVM